MMLRQLHTDPLRLPEPWLADPVGFHMARATKAASIENPVVISSYRQWGGRSW